jgi:large subunit ribosomal protein L30
MADKKKTLKVRQTASGFGRVESQRATLRGLGLGRIGRERILVDTPEVRGMLKKVAHIVKVVEE